MSQNIGGNFVSDMYNNFFNLGRRRDLASRERFFFSYSDIMRARSLLSQCLPGLVPELFLIHLIEIRICVLRLLKLYHLRMKILISMLARAMICKGVIFSREELISQIL